LDDTSSRSREGSAIITYRPGKFVNISTDLSVSDSDSDISAIEGILIDWLPLRAIRLNTNYQHSRSKPGPDKSDSIGSYAMWFITKFASVRLTYSYTRQSSDDSVTKSHNSSANLNCRF
jgi:hypothetical protein